QSPVALEVAALQIVEAAAAAADEHQQATAGVVVLAVRAQMLGQAVDALREQRDLDLGLAGVRGTFSELLHQLLLAFLGQRHAVDEASRLVPINRRARACAPRPAASAPPAPRRTRSAARLAGVRESRS